MLDLDSDPFLRFLFRIARRRVVLGFLVAAVAFAGARPTWRSIATGVPVALLGEGVRIWAAGHLVKGREVTMSGPYRLMRHPLYAGSGIIGIGFVVAAASPLVAGIVLGYLAVMTAAAVRLEEATLRADFGDTYARYAAGDCPAPRRRFSTRRAIVNGEHLAVVGLVGVVLLLSVRAWLAAQP
jgi:hypothetical protein